MRILVCVDGIYTKFKFLREVPGHHNELVFGVIEICPLIEIERVSLCLSIDETLKKPILLVINFSPHPTHIKSDALHKQAWVEIACQSLFQHIKLSILLIFPFIFFNVILFFRSYETFERLHYY